MTPYYLVLSHDVSDIYYALFRTQAEAETYEKLCVSKGNSEEDFDAMDDYWDDHHIDDVSDDISCNAFLSKNDGYIAMIFDAGLDC